MYLGHVVWGRIYKSKSSSAWGRALWIKLGRVGLVRAGSALRNGLNHAISYDIAPYIKRSILMKKYTVQKQSVEPVVNIILTIY